MKKIISHNTMSYLTPSKWYARLFNFVAKCQNKPLTDQLELVDGVDLRVFYKEGRWYFAHGMAEYDSCCMQDIHGVMSIIEFLKPKCVVRIILEKVKKDIHKEFDEFAKLCKRLEEEYPTILFVGGRFKKDWTSIYSFKHDYYPTQQFVSSMVKDTKWYEKFIPKLYAKRMNKTNRDKIQYGLNLFDFIGDY